MAHRIHRSGTLVRPRRAPHRRDRATARDRERPRLAAGGPSPASAAARARDRPHASVRTGGHEGGGDTLGRSRFGAGFLELDDAMRRKIVDVIASPDDATDNRAFFVRIRYLVVGGYFTSDIGFQAIGYIGNVPLQAFPGVSPEAKSIVEEELRKLGL
ncbi:gluconate 2-dehydrogenase subunit 3 family protein [Nonomuraea sp. NPDC050202]|uniref:gluconate 2-dehydrogenase subunit 3 family protein n=1 Tax=Nonomuraea sp. NPDC050202 TaxID=3155035 RepID=UPI0033EA0613